ncbi:MAG: 16S rRNA (cytidine(1402)-2'-O)-methyltransferase [bacterium]|nr:16S rRNA (cytidine(1402)-2'-O)-methyltransferase [bacterium]
MKFAILYIVATPIGNLQDIGSRAIEVLKGADLILAEDTRVTKKLLNHYNIRTPVLSYHQHSQLQKVDSILKLLERGKNLALVSDAGTPGISDPGNKLVREVAESLSDKVAIVSIPGPSALAAAASVCGFPMDKFLFLGFPPAKNKRQRFFKEVLESKYPVVLYESSHRILRTLEELNSILNTKYQILNTRLVVCQELTKMFEKTYRGTISEVLDKMKGQDLRGEFVIILSNQKVRKDE